MRHWQLALMSVAALLAAACEQKPQPQPTVRTETAPPQPLSRMDAAATETDPYATDTLAPSGRAKTGGDVNTGMVDTGRTGKAAKPGPSAKPGPAAGARTHTVQKGETLSSIAKKYYNDPNKWKKIWDANKSVVPDQNRLKVGTKLVIP